MSYPTAIRIVGGLDDSRVDTIKTAETLPQLAALVAPYFRPAFTTLLQSHLNIWRKVSSCRAFGQKLTEHRDRGTFPADILGAVAVPTVQYSKEYAAQASKATCDHEMASFVKTCREKSLARLITEKEKEVKFLLSKVSLESCLVEIEMIVRDASKHLAANNGLEVDFHMPKPLEPASADGAVKFSHATASGVPNPEQGEYLFLMDNGSAILRRTATIARLAHDAKTAAKAKVSSKVVSATEDIVMGGQEDTNASIQQLINNSLSDFARKLNLGSGTKKTKRKSHPHMNLHSRTNFHLRATETRRKSENRSKEGLRPSEEGQQGRKGEGEEFRKEEGRKKVNRLSVVFKPCSADGSYHVCEGRRRWPSPPQPLLCTAVRNDDLFLYLPSSVIKEWVASYLPRDLVEYTPSLDEGIFMQPGINLPKDVEYSLIHNGKFIFHREPNPHLVGDAWVVFENTLRWRYHHGDQPERKFLPRFHVKSMRPARYQDLDFESGLTKGRHLTRRNVESVLPLKSVKLLNPNLSRVRQVLQDKQLLVLGTDKNLGIAVVDVHWYNEQAIKQLGDKTTYRNTHHLMVLQYIRRAKSGIIKACEEANETIWPDEIEEEWEFPILSKYLMHSVNDEPKIPEFKGLPKIHKSPWTLRPIIPSHSWITSGASQVVDYLLRPILDTMPWIVNSTIQVLHELQSVPMTRDEQVWLISGDVQSFYTNVPIDDTIQGIMEMAYELGYSHWKLIMLESLLEAIMRNNCCRFKSEYYLQLSGIAMGTSCAPAFANLYASRFEQDIPEWKATTGLRYYCRYIDDILIIFVGTAAQRDALLRKVKLGDLIVTWEIRTAFEGLAFLDLELFFSRDSQTRGLHTRLFRKKLNRNMYIPWSSAHPDSVKKSFIKGELTRLMYLSSQKEYFEESKRSFYINLRKRGYPAEILSLWFTQVNYTERAAVLRSTGIKRQQRDIPLIMPSEYNLVWNYVNLHEVYAAIRAQWQMRGVDIPTSLKGPLVLSLRRTRNLSDMSTVWNKALLNPNQQRNRAAVSREVNKHMKRSHFAAFSKLAEDDIDRKPQRPRLRDVPDSERTPRRSRTPDPFLSLFNRTL